MPTDRLLAMPMLGRATPLNKLRLPQVCDTPLRPIYRIDPGRILIVRLLHVAQKWP